MAGKQHEQKPGRYQIAATVYGIGLVWLESSKRGVQKDYFIKVTTYLFCGCDLGKHSSLDA